MKYEINNHTFEIETDYPFFNIKWTSYMDMEFTIAYEPTSDEMKELLGYTHVLRLKRESRTDWEDVYFLYEHEGKTIIMNHVKDICKRFTETY
jgi:hypothetical protein